MGFTPACLAALTKWTAPKILPWSVMATAGMPSSFTRWQSFSTSQAPSSREESVCRCRWTNWDMGSVEPVYRNRDRGKPGNLRGRRLTGAGTRGLSFLQKATGLRDEFCHFEGLYQAGDAVFLQVGASITRFHSVGEGEQDVAFHSGAIFSEPLVGFFGGPLARHVAVHDEGVKRFREQASLHILGGPRGHDRGACTRQHIALKLKHGFFFLHQQHAAVRGAIMLAGSRLRRFSFDPSRYHRGQPHLDDSAAIGCIVGGDVATMFFHNPVANAKPESGAFAHALGSVEGIEDALGIFDSSAIVGELRANVSTLARDPNLELPRAPGL